MRLILFTGKGGVGKSSLSAATAVSNARRGRRTLLVSSDFAHNLSDIFGRSVGSAGVEVSDRLTLLEVNVLDEIREHWSSVQEYYAQFFAYLGLDDVVAEEVALLPGMDEIFLLARILREVEEGNHDTIIVDCAPTAMTLHLLTFSDTSSQKLNKILDIERKIVKLVRPVGRRIKGFRNVIPEDDVFESFGKLVNYVGKLGELLKNPKVASIRLVLNPDPIAIAETRRSYTYLALFSFPVDGIFVNKVFPKELSRGYLKESYKAQLEALKVINRSFLDTRVFTVPHLAIAPAGLEALGELGDGIYGRSAPDAVLSAAHPVKFQKRKGKVSLSFALPDLDKAELDIGRKENDLILSAAGHTRVLQLPDSLARADVEGASYKDNRLVVTFEAATKP